MASFPRDRKYAKGEPKGDGRIPRLKKERPEPPNKEKPVRANPVRAELGEPDGLDLLRLIQDAETISREFHTATLAQPLATNYRAIGNKHAQGSKYLGPGFKGRSRLFVPKTLLAVRKNMATAAAALFSTDAVANISAVYEDDAAQRATAATKKELLNYRLTRGNTPTSINWFLICMAGVRDSQLQGAVVSKQYWEFATAEDGEEEEIAVDVLDDDTNEFVETIKIKRPIKKIVRDRPVIDLIAIENCSIDPAAPWWDPVGGGRWFRARYALYVQEAKDMIASAAPEQGFLPLDQIDFTKGRIDDAERSATRRAREGGRDRIEQSRVGAFDPIWLVENFIRVEGRDLHFWTIGEGAFASKVNETSKVCPAFGGDRPYKLGVAAIEGHKPVPMSPVEAWQPLQLELNDISNLRLDTLKRAIAPLTLVKRGKKVDLAALLRRGQPEAIVQVDALEDVQFTATPAPPGQAYTESSITSNLFDELAGVMSTSSVANNRQLNETVGGMRLMSGAANSVSEFDLRIVVETWVEPVLRQVSRLIDYYETDEVALRVAGAKAQAWQRYGYLPSFEDLERTEVSIRVNVGIGSADPMQRLAKLTQVFQLLLPMSPELKAQGITLNGEELIEEAFGQAGFKDGRRFFTFGEAEQNQGPPPELIELMEKMKIEAAKLDVARAKMQMEFQSEREERATKLQIAREEGQRETMQDMVKLQADSQARQEQRFDSHVARASDQNFQREARASEQGFQRETKQNDQDFQREDRAQASMEARMGKVADYYLNQGRGKAIAPKETPAPPVPSGQDLVVSAILQRLDQMMQRQEMTAQQTTMLFARAIGELANAMRTPKQLVFNPQGRPVGVVPGQPAGAILPPRQ